MSFESININEGVYNIKYLNQSKDRFDNTISLEIYERGYSGLVNNLSIKADSLVLTETDKKITDEWISGTGCKFTVINKTTNLQFFNDLYTNDRYKHYVIIKKVNGQNIEYLFEGFIIPEIYTQQIKKNSDVVITATNQIAHLKEVLPFYLINSENVEVSFIDIIKNLVWNTRLLHPIFIKNTVWSDDLQTDFDEEVTVFDVQYINKEIFYDNEEWMTSFEVLEHILKINYCRLYWKDRKWFIERYFDLKTYNKYKVYYPEDYTEIVELNNNTLQLNEQNILSNNSMSYESGYGRYELNLNVLLLQNIAVTDFSDVQSIQTFYPTPQPKKWSINNNTVQQFAGRYSDSFIDNGLTWNGSSHSVYNWPVMLSTTVLVDWKSSFSMNLKYKMVRNNINFFNKRKFRTRYAVRLYKRLSFMEFEHKWVYEKEYDISGVQWTRFELSNMPKYFEKVFSANQARENKGLFEITDSIDFTNITNDIKIWLDVKNNFQVVVDILGFEIETGEGTDEFQEVETRFGDFELTTDYDLDDNNYEVELEDVNNYKVKNDSLLIYDYSSINTLNSILVKNQNSTSFPSRSEFWREKDKIGRKKLQLLYLSSLIQQYNENRHLLNVEIIPTTNVTLHFNDLFEFVHIPNKSFLVVGRKYNVSKSSFQLVLQEFVDDDGYYLIQDLGIDPGTSVQLDVSPDFVEQTFNTTYNSQYQVLSNSEWEVYNITYTHGNNWITVNPDKQFGDLSINIFITQSHLESDYIAQGIPINEIPDYRDAVITFRAGYDESNYSYKNVTIRQWIEWDLDNI